MQFAKEMGAEVTAVDSAIKAKMLTQLGADYFFDYTKIDIIKISKSYDVLFNMVAKSRYSDFIRILNPKGRYLLGNPRLSDMCRSIVTSKFTSKKVIFAFAGEKLEELVDLKDMIEKGKIKAIIDKVYPHEKVVSAHKKVESEQRIGSVVLSFGVKHDL